jgi:chromosome segregation ATPase
LLERDDALCRAHEDLEGARSVAASCEAEVVTARAQLQWGRAALEETEGLKTALADKAVALTAVEQQLQQERAACQKAEGQLQQERAALVEARAALERERMAREEALGQLQQECTALEGAQATLKQREDEVSRLNGELVQISILHEDLRQSLEEQGATVLNLQRQAEEARQSLEGKKKKVEGEFSFARFLHVDLFFLGFAPNFVSICSRLSGLWTALGNMTTHAEVVQTAYNSSQQELEALQAAALETC